jgi:hypothetical protein
MARFFGIVTLIIGVLAALTEIGAFIMDKGGAIRQSMLDLVRPTESAPPPPAACTRNKNPLVEILCEDKRDGTLQPDLGRK